MSYHTPGTRYSNSAIYDEATDRTNEFGDTIFVQKREDGTLTGREAVVIGGRLMGLEVAGQEHERNIRDAAPALLAALEQAVQYVPRYHAFAQHRTLVREELQQLAAQGSRDAKTLLLAIDAIASARR